jgi:formylglycine-generating enzyme required for sulfatase activity
MFSAVLDELGDNATLAAKARCFGLLGAAARDLAPEKHEPADVRYKQVAEAVMGIFDAERSQSVDIRVAIEAAEALGQAGDPRFELHSVQKNWIEIPVGEFWMGAQKERASKRNYDREASRDDSPVHRVYLDAYRIGRYPVTVGEYQRFVEEGGYEDDKHWQAGGFGEWQKPDEWDEQLEHPTRPVVWVSWYEAAAYAAWAGCRLPTEAEWERAARGTEGRKYPWGSEPKPNPLLLNYDESKIYNATPVGVYPRGATPDGILDMAGNVQEWCRDWFGDYSGSDVRNPGGPAKGQHRLLRGGCWGSVAWGCRSSFRDCYHPTIRDVLVGFRLASGF